MGGSGDSGPHARLPAHYLLLTPSQNPTVSIVSLPTRSSPAAQGLGFSGGDPSSYFPRPPPTRQAVSDVVDRIAAPGHQVGARRCAGDSSAAHNQAVCAL